MSSISPVVAVAVGVGALAGGLSLGYVLGRCRRDSSSNVLPIDDLQGTTKYSEAEKDLRCKLAAAYRVIDVCGWTEGIYNHISVRVPGNDDHFLINPFGLHYSEVTAANLVKVDLQGNIIDPGTTKLGINLTGFVIHSAIHEARKDVHCVMHLHRPTGAAVSAMKFGLLPISQDSFYLNLNDVSYHDFQGPATDVKEKEDIARSLGPTSKALVLRNHGLVGLGETIETAFSILRLMINACEIQVAALSAGRENLIEYDRKKLARITDPVSIIDVQYGELEFECLMRYLDRKGYKTGYKYKFKDYMSH